MSGWFVVLVTLVLLVFLLDWKASLIVGTLIPLSLANMIAVMFVRQFDWDRWTLFPISIGLFVVVGLISTAAKRAELSRRKRASLVMG